MERRDGRGSVRPGAQRDRHLLTAHARWGVRRSDSGASPQIRAECSICDRQASTHPGDPASPDQFAVELDKIFDQAGGFYVRGRRVVRLVMHACTLISEELKPAALSLEARQHSRPWAYVDTPFGRVERDVPVSKFMSEMYLSKGSWGLPVFNGVSTMPIFHEDGSFRCVEELFSVWLLLHRNAERFR